jgi:hypothetical protein
MPSHDERMSSDMTQEQDHALLQLTDELKRHLADVVNGVQEAKEVRTAAYEQVELLSKELTAMLKGRELLPRRTLLVLDMAANTLENEAPYAKQPARVTAMADAIRKTLGLVLRGEAHEDRKPGVPRIV